MSSESSVAQQRLGHCCASFGNISGIDKSWRREVTDHSVTPASSIVTLTVCPLIPYGFLSPPRFNNQLWSVPWRSFMRVSAARATTSSSQDGDTLRRRLNENHSNRISNSNYSQSRPTKPQLGAVLARQCVWTDPVIPMCFDSRAGSSAREIQRCLNLTPRFIPLVCAGKIGLPVDM